MIDSSLQPAHVQRSSIACQALGLFLGKQAEETHKRMPCKQNTSLSLLELLCWHSGMKYIINNYRKSVLFICVCPLPSITLHIK